MQEYPRMVYRKHETAVVETEEELASMIAQGWTTRPGGLSEASILKARIAETETESISCGRISRDRDEREK